MQESGEDGREAHHGAELEGVGGRVCCLFVAVLDVQVYDQGGLDQVGWPLVQVCKPRGDIGGNALWPTATPSALLF